MFATPKFIIFGTFVKKSENFSQKSLEVKFFYLPLQSQMKGKHNRGVAQLASASGLGPEGPVFESQYPDKKATIDW